MNRRLRSEYGFALASAIILMFIVLLLTASITTVVISSLHQTTRDRNSAEAFQLADSGVDEVTWHMNRELVSTEVRDLAGITTGVVSTDGCLGLSDNNIVLQVLTSTPANGFCNALSIPSLPAGEATQCYTEARVGLDLGNVSSLVNNLLTRNVICQGDVGGAKRRILARMALKVSAGTPTTLWRRDAWVECAGDFTSTTDPMAGCPSLPAIGS